MREGTTSSLLKEHFIPAQGSGGFAFPRSRPWKMPRTQRKPAGWQREDLCSRVPAYWCVLPPSREGALTAGGGSTGWGVGNRSGRDSASSPSSLAPPGAAALTPSKPLPVFATAPHAHGAVRAGGPLVRRRASLSARGSSVT